MLLVFKRVSNDSRESGKDVYVSVLNALIAEVLKKVKMAGLFPPPECPAQEVCPVEGCIHS